MFALMTRGLPGSSKVISYDPRDKQSQSKPAGGQAEKKLGMTAMKVIGSQVIGFG